MLKRMIAVLVVAALPVVALAHSGSHKKVMGTISKIEATRLHITTKDGKDSDVKITSKTKFTLNKKASSLKAAKPGMRVVVELSSKGPAETVHLGKMDPKAPKSPKH